MTRNSLPDNLHDALLSDDKFTAALKTHFSPIARTHLVAHLRRPVLITLYKCTITYLLTYL